MLISFLGTRGTHPSSGQGTMSFLIDNKILFDINPEFVISNKKFIESWTDTKDLDKIQTLYGKPSFSKIEHIFLSHFHFDHWGGLRHLLIYLQMFDPNRSNRPLNIYFSEKSINIFKFRMKEIFNVSVDGLSAEEFFLRYLLIEIDASIIEFVKIRIIKPDTPITIGSYQIHCFNTTHMEGSLAFKLVHTKYKIKEEAFSEYNIPKGPLLSKIQKEGKIDFNNRIITVSEVFKIEKTIIGYSSDTKVDLDLLAFFQDSTVLLHETTYFTDEEEFHTDVHSSLDDLIKNISRMNYLNLKLLLPVHFSGRYRWEEIIEVLENFNNMTKFDIKAPKFGNVIYYDEKNKIIDFKSLDSSKYSF